MKIDPGDIEFQLEHIKKHTINDVLTAVSGLQCIGSLLESLPNMGGVTEFSELQLTGLGSAILSLSKSIGSDMVTIDEALEAASGVINTAKESDDHDH